MSVAPQVSWLERYIPRLFVPLHPLLRLYGVDIEQFEVLLTARLRLAARTRERPGVQFGLFALCGMLFVMSLLVGFIASLLDPFHALALLQGVAIAYLFFAMVADGSEQLLDASDEALVMSAPVSDRTVAAARIAHLATYMLLLLASLAAAPLFIGLFSFDAAWWLPVFIASSLLALAFTMFLVVVIYALALRMGGAARFKAVASWVQIGMSGLFYVIYWGLRPVMKELGGQLPAETSGWWLAVPPAWFGGLAAWASGADNGIYRVHALLAVAVPPILGAVGLNLLRSRFMQALVARQDTGAGGSDRREGLTARWRRWVCRNRFEDAGYRFFFCMATREHRYRLRVVPALIMFPAMATGVLVQESYQIRESVVWALPLYALVFLCMAAAEGVRYSDDHEAGWIYGTALSDDLGGLVAGVAKAILSALLFLPAPLYLAALVVFAGPDAALHGALALAIIIPVSIGFLSFVLRNDLPFTRQPTRSADGTVMVIVIFNMIVAAAVAGLHYGVAQLPGAELVALPVAGLGGVLAWRWMGRWTLKIEPSRRSRTSPTSR